MKTLCRCLILAALGILLVPAAARAQFGFFPYGGFGYGGGFGGVYGGYGGSVYGGYGGVYGGYGGGLYGGYGGYQYGGGYSTIPTYSTTYIMPVLYTASTTTAPPRMRPTEYPAIPYRDTPFEVTKSFIDVHLPTADASVWIDGVRMTQAGTERRFVTPALDPGPLYTMEVRASWRAADGKEQSRTQRIDVRAGEYQSVAFLP